MHVTNEVEGIRRRLDVIDTILEWNYISSDTRQDLIGLKAELESELNLVLIRQTFQEAA